MTTFMSRSRGGQSAGQAMAEFAIVLPILLIILIAVFDVGRLVFAYNDITNAARNGARVAIVDQTANKARDVAIQGAGLGLKNSQVQVTYLTDDLSGTCPSPYQLGCVAKVAVSYDWQPITPLIGNILGPITVKTDTTLPIERIYP